MVYRALHAFRSKTGYYKQKFPVTRNTPDFPTVAAWRAMNIPFFIASREDLGLDKNLSDDLKLRFRESENNIQTFFNSQKLTIDKNHQWSVNPETGYQYDMSKHWSEIQDLSVQAGDIKYVWEKARFSYLYDLMRYDYHSSEDQFSRVFGDIQDFIDKNPMNLGPQYKCSQEISLRILNWSYALHYYKNHHELTDQLFKNILTSIYEQLHHVWDHIDFSRIAVRNNHAITETLTLYLSGLLFPFIAETKKWSSQGKTWFEQEVSYQIYEDGTFLQHSMNYHRVVVQLFTWGIGLAHLNKERFSDVVYDRATKSLRFLDVCLDTKSGHLPNYGNNDGALFFKFTDDDYRDYRPQLNDLRAVLSNEVSEQGESYQWYGINAPKIINHNTSGTHAFNQGGYYISNENDGLKTFIRCASYRDRPFQADNMHLDLWRNGVNYVWDCGTYKYNTTVENLNHFQGSAGHNTITIDGEDHMLKGSRFIWFYWIKKATGSIFKDGNSINLKTTQEAYRYKSPVTMTREVLKKLDQSEWQILDRVEKASGSTMMQHWQVNPAMLDHITIIAKDANGTELQPLKESSFYSSYYGVKEPSIKLTFATETSIINTSIILA
jgi:hypothetical protein